jgi:hypothetical protein
MLQSRVETSRQLLDPDGWVQAHYTGRLEDCTVFDSSYKRGKPVTFRVGVSEVHTSTSNDSCSPQVQPALRKTCLHSCPDLMKLLLF